VTRRSETFRLRVWKTTIAVARKQKNRLTLARCPAYRGFIEFVWGWHAKLPDCHAALDTRESGESFSLPLA
jgi:hypothetical protein